MSPMSSAEFEIYKNDFFGDKELCDVTLTDGSGEIHVRAHRLVLSERSKYLSSMFSNAESNNLRFKEIDGETLQMVISFMYSTEIEPKTLKTAKNVLKAARLLGMERLESECWYYIQLHLDTRNVLGVLFLGVRYNITYMQDIAFVFALKNFMQLRHNEEFFSMEVHQLSKLISNQNLCVSSEEDVFYAIWSWIKHDRNHRERFFEELWQYLRFELLSPKFIASVVESAERSCKSNAYKWKSLVPHPLASQSSSKDYFIVIGGFYKPQQSIKVALYSPALNKWSYRDWPGLPEAREYFGSVTVDGKLYIAGGIIGNREPSNRVDCLDLKTLQWIQLPPLLTARYGCAMTTLNGQLYVVGGDYDECEGLNSVEKWDPLIGKWEYIAPMSDKNERPIVGVKGSSLCVARGDLFPDKILDIYDPLTKKWTYEWSRAKTPLYGMGTVPIHKVDHFLTISKTEIKNYNLENNEHKIIPVNYIDVMYHMKFALFNDIFITCHDGCFTRYCQMKNKFEKMPALDESFESQRFLLIS